MDEARPIFRPAGDTGLVVEFGAHIDRAVSRRVVALHTRIHAARLPGVIETVPTFRSLLIHLDPDVTSVESVHRAVIPLLDGLEAKDVPPRQWTVPVCYEAAFAPDLIAVAEQCGLSPSQLVEIHSANAYHVYMIGFLPGLPYMGDLAQELVLPRLVEPRVRVPPGSVAIATTLTTIYPLESPGGWHLIGRTPVKLFDTERAVPALLNPGDRVSFAPISSSKFAELEKLVECGRHELRAIQ
jgi:KipI family sensor histidine kinase inhibitor